MRFIIMSNGSGKRWQNYNNIPKQLIDIGHETLLQRTVRLLKAYAAESAIIITSRNKLLETKGAELYKPLQDSLEIDRFTYELIEEDTCFLYGDTYYTESAIKTIVNQQTEDILFFGNSQRIFAVKVKDAQLMKTHIDIIKKLFLSGEINDCKGWQLYQSITGTPFGDKTISEKYFLINDITTDFNRPEEYELFIGKTNCGSEA